MMYFINAFHLVFILKLMRIDASVTIHSIGIEIGNGNFECGDKLTLTCQITGNPVSMTWQNDSSSVPLANCILSSCSVHPDVANEYTFTQDTGKGIFNLTFDVTNYNNGTTYRCDDTLNFDTTFISVRDFRPTLKESNQTKQVEIISGCISSGETVTFTWKKIKIKNNTIEESDHDTSNSNRTYFNDATSCALDVDCGGPNLIKKGMSIEVEQGGSNDYYLKVILSYDGVDMESPLSSQTYKINDSSIVTKQTQIVTNVTQTTVAFTSDMSSLVHNYTSHNTQMSSTTTNQNLHQCVWIIVECWYIGGMALCFIVHMIAEIVFAIYILCKNDKDSCCSKVFGYITTALSSLPIHVLLVLSIIKWVQCSCENPCSSCEIHCVLRYYWIGLVVLHYIFALCVIVKIRKRCKVSNMTYRNASILEDADIPTITFFFTFLTYVLLICYWIRSKLKKEENGEIEKVSAHPSATNKMESGKENRKDLQTATFDRKTIPPITYSKNEDNVHPSLKPNNNMKKNTSLKPISQGEKNDGKHLNGKETEEIDSKSKLIGQKSKSNETSSSNRDNSVDGVVKLTDQRNVRKSENQKEKKSKKRKRTKDNCDTEMNTLEKESKRLNNEGKSLTKENDRQKTTEKQDTNISTGNNSEIGNTKSNTKFITPRSDDKSLSDGSKSQHHSGTPAQNDKSCMRRGLSTNFDDPKFREVPSPE